MANSIFQRQNQPEILKCLVVQRRLYSRVKGWRIVPALATVLSFVVPFVSKPSTDGCGVSDWVSTGFAVLVWVSTGIIGLFRDSIIKLAAGFQQHVDCCLFAVAFGNCPNCSGMPLPSEIALRISKVTQTDIEREKVQNWYSDYSSFSEQYAALCCQKENVRWDQSLRILLLVVLLVIMIGWVAWAVARLFDVTLRCALPILCWHGGAVVLLGKICFALCADILRINRMRELFRRTEAQIVRGEDASKELANLQGLIYEHRKNAFLVPNVVYKLSRKWFQSSEDRLAKCHQEMLA